MPINIPIAADSRQFIGATKDMAKGLDDVADALDDVTRDSQKGTDKLEDGFKDAQRQTEKTEKSFKDLARTVERESKDAGKAIDKGIGDGLKDAESGMGDFKDEAKNEAREAASSFSGEFDDVGDLIQSTLANALGGFGPLGAAAGIAAAAGFGAFYAKIQADSEASEERVSSMFQSMIDDQRNYLSESAILGKVAEYAEDQGKLTEAQDIAAASGRSLAEVLRAMAGDAEANAAVQADLQKALDDHAKSAKDAAAAGEEVSEADQQAALAAGQAKDKLSGYSDELDKAAGLYSTYAEAARYANNEMQDAAKEAAGLRTEIVKLPSGKTINVTFGVQSEQLTAKVNRALNNARALASKGIDVPFQITKNGSKVY